MTQTSSVSLYAPRPASVFGGPCLVLLALLFILLRSSVHAQSSSSSAQNEAAREISHIVKEGETLASISLLYYGTDRNEKILVSDNALGSDGGQSIVVGMRLRIPTLRFHKVEAGETWRSLADRYLGSASRGKFIARANKSDAAELPDTGRLITIPYALRYTAIRNDTLKKVAKIYLGSASTDNVQALRDFNGGIGIRLGRGKIVLVPLLDLKLTKAMRERIGRGSDKPDTEALKKAQEKNETHVQAVENANREGRHIRAIARGSVLIGHGNLTASQELRVSLALAIAFVAENEKEAAKKHLARALHLRPDLVLEPARYSPKLIKIFERLKKKKKK